jgi:hypothetical protein
MGAVPVTFQDKFTGVLYGGLVFETDSATDGAVGAAAGVTVTEAVGDVPPGPVHWIL